MKTERDARELPVHERSETPDELLTACEEAAAAFGLRERSDEEYEDRTWSIELECDYQYARRVYLTWRSHTVGSFPVAVALGAEDNEPFFDDETPSPSAVVDLVRRAVATMRELGKHPSGPAEWRKAPAREREAQGV